MSTIVLFVVALQVEPQPAMWTSHRGVADAISTAATAANLAAEIRHAWQQPDRRGAIGCVALRNGLVVGATETAKALVRRTRPDASDRKSFYSEHTALAIVNTGWHFQVSIPIAIGAGYGRAAAGKHFTSDIVIGAAVGVVMRRVCRVQR